MSFLRQLAAFLLLLVLCASPGSAQEHTAALSGAVRGQNAGLPQVIVRLHSEKPNQVLATTVIANDGSSVSPAFPAVTPSPWRSRVPDGSPGASAISN